MKHAFTGLPGDGDTKDAQGTKRLKEVGKKRKGKAKKLNAFPGTEKEKIERSSKSLKKERVQEGGGKEENSF